MAVRRAGVLAPEPAGIFAVDDGAGLAVGRGVPKILARASSYRRCFSSCSRCRLARASSGDSWRCAALRLSSSSSESSSSSPYTWLLPAPPAVAEESSAGAGSRFAIFGGGRRLSTVTAGLTGVVVCSAGGDEKVEAPGAPPAGRYWWNVGWVASLFFFPPGEAMSVVPG